MSGVGPPPPREQIWVQILRETDLDGQPVRSEGLELIETTDPAQFFEVGWAALLLVNDYFLRMLERAGSDDAFVVEWQRHSGTAGNGRLMLLERMTDVCGDWLVRLGDIARHHRAASSEPATAHRIPRELYRSGSALDVLGSDEVGVDVKFDLLRALTRVAIAHSALATVRLLIDADEAPTPAHEAAAWLHTISAKILVAGHNAPPVLYGLDPTMLSTIERFCDDLLPRYATEIVGELRSRPDVVAMDRRAVVVDPQLACDVCVLRIVGALGAAWRSGREADWTEVERWRAEGRRILHEPPRRRARLGRLDLSAADDWFEPSFGAGWPGCVADAEEIARFYLTAVASRGGSAGGRRVARRPGELIDILTRTRRVLLRVPGFEARPGEGGSPVDAAFVEDPMLTWMLFPSTGASTAGCFWTHSAYGRFVTSLEGLAAEGPSGGGAPVLPTRGFFGDLPPSLRRAAAELAAPLIAEWIEWGTAEPGRSQPSR